MINYYQYGHIWHLTYIRVKRRTSRKISIQMAAEIVFDVKWWTRLCPTCTVLGASGPNYTNFKLVFVLIFLTFDNRTLNTVQLSSSRTGEIIKLSTGLWPSSGEGQNLRPILINRRFYDIMKYILRPFFYRCRDRRNLSIKFSAAANFTAFFFRWFRPPDFVPLGGVHQSPKNAVYFLIDNRNSSGRINSTD